MKIKKTSSEINEEVIIEIVKLECIRWSIFGIRLVCYNEDKKKHVEVILKNVDVALVIFLGIGIIGWIIPFLF